MNDNYRESIERIVTFIGESKSFRGEKWISFSAKDIETNPYFHYFLERQKTFRVTNCFLHHRNPFDHDYGYAMTVDHLVDLVLLRDMNGVKFVVKTADGERKFFSYLCFPFKKGHLEALLAEFNNKLFKRVDSERFYPVDFYEDILGVEELV